MLYSTASAPCVLQVFARCLTLVIILQWSLVVLFTIFYLFLLFCVLLIKHYSLLVVFDRNFMSRLHKLEGPLTSNPWDCSELGLVSVFEP